MASAQDGQTVKIHYTGKLEDGTVFDSSEGNEPLEFQLGEEQVIPGFENAVKGMDVGESKTVAVPADEAYGPHREEMMLTVDKDQFPDEAPPEVGNQYSVDQGGGHTLTVTVTDVQDEEVTLDANHPLAGKDLTFDIELVEVS